MKSSAIHYPIITIHLAYYLLGSSCTDLKMPKSKRSKVVHLSKTQKKGKELSERLYANVRESVDTYQYCFVFSVENMRNTYLKEVRTEFSDSRYCPSLFSLRFPTPVAPLTLFPHLLRIFFAKTKVMAVALGTSPEMAYQPNLDQLSRHLVGNVGLLFTSRTPAEILEYFSTYAQSDYARAGTVATRTFTIPAGIVHSRAGEIEQDEDVSVAHSLEPGMRALGVPTSLKRGKIELSSPYEVCRAGQTLDSKQTRLLKMFGVQTADFRVGITA